MEHSAYYEFMGIGRDADKKTIVRAYRKLSRKYHPDRNPDDAEALAMFQKLTNINAVLCDPIKRAHYDRFGVEGLEECDSGGESEAEEGVAEEEEEMDAASFEALLNKFKDKGNVNKCQGNVTKFSKIEETFKTSLNYKPSAPAPWREETVTEEWSLARDAGAMKLYWDRMYLPSFPNIIEPSTYAKSVKVLTLSVNQLSSLPSCFEYLLALEELDLSTNQFTEIPNVIFSLSKLQKLSFERNQLTTISDQLSRLTELRTLSFFGNTLESLDDDLFEGMTKLCSVDLELNRLQEIPQSLLHLQSTIENFILKKDDLTFLPPTGKKATGKRKRGAKTARKNPSKRQRIPKGSK